MQRLTAVQYAQTLFEVLQDTSGPDHDKVLDNFIDAIKINGDQNMAGEILLAYTQITKANANSTPQNKTVIEELNKLATKKNLDKSSSGVLLKIDPNDLE